MLLPYILVAAAIGIPIYVTHRIIKQHRKKAAAAIWEAQRARRLTPSQRYRERLLRHRLRKFNLSEFYAELVFGPRWRIKLRKKHIESNHGFFFDIIAIKTKLLFDLGYRKKILQGYTRLAIQSMSLVDNVILMIDSVFNEDPEIVRIYKKFMNENKYHKYYYENQWEYFKAHKKTEFDPNSENIFDKTEAYKILGLDISATIEQVKKKYRELALRLHPDKNMANKTQAEQKFVKINLAYETIMAAA
ncbi:J domain-containing protein [Marine Group I thaumarchaeote]|uniref:J domain-containing protein n=1 Tax=Marine Group I thaumarchaeote TaxID=2511932 RepID=A0A7K4NS96_9ARCH|nr:J domain-containing protein [Marine Group I thaumarchaeote]